MLYEICTSICSDWFYVFLWNPIHNIFTRRNLARRRKHYFPWLATQLGCDMRRQLQKPRL